MGFDEQWNGKDKKILEAGDKLSVAYDEATAIRRTGFIAQEVEKAANAANYNFSGIVKPRTAMEHYSLSYESFVVPLVKAIQEQQLMIEKQDIINADQKAIIDALIKRVEVLEAASKIEQSKKH